LGDAAYFWLSSCQLLRRKYLVSKRVFKIAEKVIAFNRNIRAADALLWQSPKVFAAVSIGVAVSKPPLGILLALLNNHAQNFAGSGE
jgi:hypothetical protein